jgi:DNA-binding CsgD family transcriptional regulator
MSGEHTPLGRAMRLLSELLDDVDAGMLPQLALCIRLAETLNASAAIYVSFDTISRRCTTTCWPRTPNILRAGMAIEYLSRAFPLLFPQIVRDNTPSCVSDDADPLTWRGSPAELLLWEILRCRDVAQIPLTVSGTQLRLVALARRRSFTAREMTVLLTAHHSLAALDNVLRSIGPSPPDQASPGLGGLSPNSAEPADHGNLTPREIEVLSMLAEGLLARTIAARMRVSTRTVHKHLGNIYRKLEAHDRLLAVNRAQSLGLIPTQRSPRHQ